MSRTFYIPQQKSILKWRRPAVMTIGAILQLVKDLSICNIHLNEDDIQKMHSMPLSSMECIQVGILGKSGRTIELAYDQAKESYTVQVFTPSTRSDWKIAIELIQQLARHCKSVVIDEDGVQYPTEEITFDYEKDIAFGLQLALEKKIAFLGVRYPFHFSDAMIERIHNAADKVAEFGNILHEHQYQNAYFARQMITERDKLSGIYVIPPDLPLILPYTPEVEFLIYQQPLNVEKWLAIGMGFAENDTDRQIIGEMDYSVFIQHLSADKYHFIDEKYILLQALNQQEIAHIFQSAAL